MRKWREAGGDEFQTGKQEILSDSRESSTAKTKLYPKYSQIC